jgi:UDP-glucose:glycoprotein glucosyltransferase
VVHVWSLALGVQAAQLILKSSNPIETLVHLSQDFPRYATEISRKVELDGELQFEMAKTESMVPKGTNMLWLNGKVIDNHNDFNPFK